MPGKAHLTLGTRIFMNAFKHAHKAPWQEQAD